MLFAFGLSILAHVFNKCMNYSAEIRITTSCVYSLSWLLLMMITVIYIQEVTFCSKRQKSNRTCLLIAGYASLASSLQIYDGYTIIGGTLLGIFGILQVLTTIILFVVCFMHGHSPRCLRHVDETDKDTKRAEEGMACACLKGKKNVGKWIGGNLILFIISQLVLVSLAIGFDYTLKAPTAVRPDSCKNI